MAFVADWGDSGREPTELWDLLRSRRTAASETTNLDLDMHGVILRNVPMFYIILQEACEFHGLWAKVEWGKNGPTFQPRWSLDADEFKFQNNDVWGPWYGVCRHVGWAFDKKCHCGAPSSIRISQSRLEYVTCHLKARHKSTGELVGACEPDFWLPYP